MLNTIKLFFLIIGLLVLVACSDKPAIISDCHAVDNITPICRFTNPEDMDLLPDQQTLLISQMGNMEGSLSGNLVSFDTHTQVITALFPSPEPVSHNTAASWGAANCPGMPGGEFSPHGITIKQRDDGRWQLAVVNHGQRESVEMFEILSSADRYALAWRGCVIPPPGTYMNDVALMKNGGFVASHMFDKNAPLIFGMRTGVWKSQLGINTGYVFEWLPTAADNFRILADSHGPFINGIALSADDTTVFANVYAGNEVRKLDRVTGNKIGAAKITQVDNLAWASSTNSKSPVLLGVSHSGGKLEQMDCIKHPGQTCGFGFTVVRIDTETMTSEEIFQHEGAPMGAATVAQQVGDSLYLGTFSGNRIIKMAHPL